MAMAFAGVRGTSDASNEIVIRGNSPRGLLWRLEGIEIPNPNHFAGEGASGGGVMMLSSEVLGTSDFLTGAFPAEYGNALSGVFDLKFRNGNTEKYEHNIHVGLIGVSVATEGPLSRKYKGSYLVNYRYSTIALLNTIGYNLNGDVLTKFQDFSFKLHLPTKRLGRFSVFGLGGKSNLFTEAITDSTLWQSKADREEDDKAYNIGIGGISHFLLLNEKSYIKTVLSVGGHIHGYKEHTIQTDDLSLKKTEDDFVRQFSYRINSLYNHKFNAKHLLRSGVTLSRLQYRFKGDYKANKDSFRRDEGGMTYFLQAYSQWKFRILPTLEMNTGFHFSHLFLNANSAIEPRIGMRWQFRDNQSLSFGTGLHSRLEGLSTYFKIVDETPVQQDIRMSKAFHIALGYQWNFWKDWSVKVEGYYQYLYDIPVDADSTKFYSVINRKSLSTTNRTLINEGQGRNYGIEFTIEKRLSNNYYILANTSLYRSLFNVRGSKFVSTRFDGRFIVNLSTGKDFIIGKRENQLIGIHAKLIWAGGPSYIPLNVEESIAEQDLIYYNEWGYSYRGTNYLRLDSRISYRVNREKYSWELAIDTQNTTNRKNEFARRIDAELLQERIRYQLGIIPIGSFKAYF